MSMYWMYNAVVKEPGIEDYLRRILRRYYGKWLNVSKKRTSYSYNIVISTGEESLIKLIDPLTVHVQFPKKLLNSPLKIFRMIETGRAYFRNHIVWDETYKLGFEGRMLERYEIKPAYDVMLALGSEYHRLLVNNGLEPPLNALINKRFGGEHYVYDGPYLHGKLIVPDEGFLLSSIKYRDRVYETIDLDEVLKNNNDALLMHIMVSRKFLESLGKPDIVLVSFSGGKDSLAVLHLAKMHFGEDIVRGIYVDTGVDFPHTKKYVKEMREKLGIEIDVVRSDVDVLLSRKGLPTKDNRWCTLRKTHAFKKRLKWYKKKFDRVLVLVGDRDSESVARARKPPVRKRENYLEAAPIKQWSTFLVQLYHLKYHLPFNPLYLRGFYRLGCYICPALTALEKHIMFNYMFKELEGLAWFKEFWERNQ